MNPKFALAYVGLALSELGARAAAERRSRPTSKLRRGRRRAGASIGGVGLADLALFQGRIADAPRILEKGIEADIAAQELRGCGRASWRRSAEAHLAVRASGPGDRRGREGHRDEHRPRHPVPRRASIIATGDETKALASPDSSRPPRAGSPGVRRPHPRRGRAQARASIGKRSGGFKEATQAGGLLARAIRPGARVPRGGLLRRGRCGVRYLHQAPRRGDRRLPRRSRRPFASFRPSTTTSAARARA